MTGIEQRALLVQQLRRSYLGPSGGPQEVVAGSPERTYLVGTLFPGHVAMANDEAPLAFADIESHEGLGAGAVDDNDEEVDVETSNAWQPSSQALSFLHDGPALTCHVQYGTYRQVAGSQSWQRSHHDHRDITLTRLQPTWTAGDGSASLRVRWRPWGDHTSLVTVAAVNPSGLDSDGRYQADKCLYQVELTVESQGGVILPYTSVDDLDLDDEQQELSLRYRDRKVFAIGHGTSVDWTLEGNGCVSVRTDPLPTFTVPEVTARSSDSTALSLRYLSTIEQEPDAVTQELRLFVEEYSNWLERQAEIAVKVEEIHRTAANRLVERQRAARDRMMSGVDLLASRTADGYLTRTAFTLAMSAMQSQMTQAQRSRTGSSPDPQSTPRWRPFQLGFLLLCLPSTFDPEHEDRDLVDLIWFPTGGGKTEAYLALAAFEIFKRRLSLGNRGSGTAVLTRYTLRLLTTQQFQRASALICAMELLRRSRPELKGTAPFSIGLWVGNSTTPSTQKQAIKQYDVMRKRSQPENPFQVDNCPWCDCAMFPKLKSTHADGYGVAVSGGDIWLRCPNVSCPFHERLPVEVIDENIYRRPPTILLATVDKFARLPFVPEAGVLLGARTQSAPPSLVIQDELHLLSGPLGTTVGIYDAAVLGIIGLSGGRPKVVASTATIRAADKHVGGLLARDVALFPPSGLTEDDSYFAQPAIHSAGRLYMGLMPQAFTQSRSVVLATMPLLLAPEAAATQTGRPADDYWTLVAYHSSLRELGRTVTHVRDDVNLALNQRKQDSNFRRTLTGDGVVELTGRVPASELSNSLNRLSRRYGEAGAIDVVACTNMLSVGIDVPRLSLMLMNGQPKTTSEYIQATSRVGRGETPGVVVTLYRAARPRDRSHYETFRSYHQAVYRHVEPTSVTPWSLASRKRSLPAVLVAMVRQLTTWSANDSAQDFDGESTVVRNIVENILATAARADGRELESTRADLTALVGDWRARIAAAGTDALRYVKGGNKLPGHVLMRTFDDDFADAWMVMNSMRSVDSQVALTIDGERT